MRVVISRHGAIVLGIGTLLVFGVWTHVASGTSVDCLGTDYLAQGGLAVRARYATDDQATRQMRIVAKAVSNGGEPNRVALVDIAMDGMADLPERVYLVEIPLDSTPRELYGPVGQSPVQISTACSVAVLDANGRYKFTYRYSAPVK